MTGKLLVILFTLYCAVVSVQAQAVYDIIKQKPAYASCNYPVNIFMHLVKK